VVRFKPRKLTLSGFFVVFFYVRSCNL